MVILKRVPDFHRIHSTRKDLVRAALLGDKREKDINLNVPDPDVREVFSINSGIKNSIRRRVIKNSLR